ncbi:hypothetical protein [Mycobacteroides abscessus]|uniref:hypothetical protein n=1 Tax=Mycobacteroides abscessus TaxID=36809 RepID=UPI000929608B|nr:hypothetical protein [Mycobacteroides abscessus]MBE5408240.1 hypothetical protein [Mycobacteroides abscessus]MBN7379356.1 hypothetical protein [Mycobacteroides abscessus subsp. massiliense]MBN7468729.1 hypothetical protein [Mycobacteroides abscessus subsp. massiliense]OTR18072.1 hypothetical protein B9M82_02620 [Mycobacteroides abscessus]SIK15939.1 Uncharacterised protein [Mycobacteroides abscessus subsp. abscessus]
MVVARFYLWYHRHPTWGRPLVLMFWLHALAWVATVCATPAFAANNASALNWTGVKDGSGVPIGAYYLAGIDAYKRAKENGTDATLNPMTWAPAIKDTLSGWVGGEAASVVLTGAAGFFVALLAIAVWLYRLAAKSWWIAFFGTLARPFVEAVFLMVNKIGLIAIVLPVTIAIGAYTIFAKGESARGWMIILSAFLITVLGVAIFADPVEMVYGEHGLLNTGRSMAFQVAEAAVHNGAITAAKAANDTDGQLDVFTGNLMDAVARRPFQMYQYGHVLSGTCDSAWTQVMINHPSEDAPILEMERCGDTVAARHAANLNGSNIWVGAILVLAALSFCYFLLVAGGAVFMVPVNAMYRTMKNPVDVTMGVLPEGPRNYMWQALKTFFWVGLEMFVYTLFICVAGMSIARIMGSPLPPEVGGDSPIAKMVMFGASGVVALRMFRMIQGELFPHSRQPGLASRIGWAVAGAAASAVGAKGAAAAWKAGKGLAGGHGAPPWEELESKVAQEAESASNSKAGFDTITNPKTTGTGENEDGSRTIASGGDAGADSPGAPKNPRTVPTPTTLNRPASRQNTGGPGKKSEGKRGQRPKVAGQRSKPVPVASVPESADASEMRAAGLDTIAKDAGANNTGNGTDASSPQIPQQQAGDYPGRGIDGR